MSRFIPDKKIIAVLPAYHAVRTLKRTFDAIPKDWIDEVILVDDASSDDTAALARSLGITTMVHPHNRGYGGNQKTCYREALKAGADIVIMIHPDFQYDPVFAPGLLQPIAEGKADAMFGSRMLLPGGARAGGMPWWKYLANVFLTKIGNAILWLDLSEYHSGFRAYSREILERLPIELNSDGFIFDTEIIVQIAMAGSRIGEVPIRTKYFPEASTVGFLKGVGYSLSFLFALLKYLGHRLGIVRVAAFVPVRGTGEEECPGCRGRRLRERYAASSGFRESLQSHAHYAITEAGAVHGAILQCLHCSLVFVPRNQLPDLASFYALQSFDERYLKEERGRRMTARRTLRKLSLLLGGDISGRRLLDVGPGPGFFMDEARRAGWSVWGIEPGAAWENFAREKLVLDTIRRGGNERMHEFPDGHFDVISAWDVIEHMEDPFAFFRLAAKKLAPGGILALSTPDFNSAARRLSDGRWHALIPSHITYFSRSSLRAYLTQAGFRIVHRRSYVRFFSLAYLGERVSGASMNGVLRRLILPVNFFDELEVYSVREQ